MAKHKKDPYLTSNPKHKRHGRLPPYGPRQCPLCLTKLKLGKSGLFCPNEACKWKE